MAMGAMYAAATMTTSAGRSGISRTTAASAERESSADENGKEKRRLR